MHHPNTHQVRPFPVAAQSRDGEAYRHMNPRLAAIDLLRGKVADRHAGVDHYDESVFIVDAHPHQILWVQKSLGLCGVLLGERLLENGMTRYRAVLEADVRVELNLDETRNRPVITDEPLASRAAPRDTSGEDAILLVLHPNQPRLRLLEPVDEPAVQQCRDCGRLFPHHPDADRCPACVAATLGDEPAPLLYRPALDRAARAAALRVPCGCGATVGEACGCTVGERLGSAAANGEPVDDERQVH